MPRSPTRPAAELTFTTAPRPRRLMTASARPVTRNGPLRLTARLRSQSVGSKESNDETPPPKPALFTSTSRPPRRSAAATSTLGRRRKRHVAGDDLGRAAIRGR